MVYILSVQPAGVTGIEECEVTSQGDDFKLSK